MNKRVKRKRAETYFVRQSDQHKCMSWPDMKVILVDRETTWLGWIGRHVKLDIGVGYEGLRKVETERRIIIVRSMSYLAL